MNDNINRYLGKASKHGKRVKGKRGKSDKSNKNLFSSRSGHTPTTPKPQPIPSPTLKPVTPSPVISWPTNPPFSFVNTPIPTSDSTLPVGTNKTSSPTRGGVVSSYIFVVERVRVGAQRSYLSPSLFYPSLSLLTINHISVIARR